MKHLVLSGLVWLAAGAVWAAETTAERLAAALRMAEVVQILHAEGLEQAATLDADMLGRSGGPYFAEQVAMIYDRAAMTETLTRALADNMSEAEMQDSLAFFRSDTGQRVVALELSARAAFGDADVEAAAVDHYKALPEDDPVRRLVRDYVEANALVPRNVDGIQATDFSFYLGLVAAGALERNDDGYLATLLEGRDQLIADTDEWAMSFHLMAYDPLTEEEHHANIAFSRSLTGQAFNDALFDGFDTMYGQIYYQLGLLVGRTMAATDL